jgi:hypothetical protein
MCNAANNLDDIGDGLSYIPTPFIKWMGKIISAEADVLRTISDNNNFSKNDVSKILRG